MASMYVSADTCASPSSASAAWPFGKRQSVSLWLYRKVETLLLEQAAVSTVRRGATPTTPLLAISSQASLILPSSPSAGSSTITLRSAGLSVAGNKPSSR
eukprot:CAMPEP_0173437942 /NCGR_PEP_ID=MMETSP1357-20121228/18878_1 /TAXON_ID=77926 /ORGANISM="Hemiselmis rufescens, Strain PCC563" /LENGTH=99 /DNA_ID=CAMNT_0014403171 /DNA_START=24 /DNA_END=319 /DNA_ORIENTATION=+